MLLLLAALAGTIGVPAPGLAQPGRDAPIAPAPGDSTMARRAEWTPSPGPWQTLERRLHLGKRSP